MVTAKLRTQKYAETPRLTRVSLLAPPLQKVDENNSSLIKFSSSFFGDFFLPEKPSWSRNVAHTFEIKERAATTGSLVVKASAWAAVK